jgi:hypothetical protein
MTGDPDQTDLLTELSGLGDCPASEGFEDVAVVRLATPTWCAIRWSAGFSVSDPRFIHRSACSDDWIKPEHFVCTANSSDSERI